LNQDEDEDEDSDDDEEYGDDDDDIDSAPQAFELGDCYVHGKNSFVQTNVCSKLFELAAGEAGIQAYESGVEAKGRLMALRDDKRGVADHNQFHGQIRGKTGYHGFLDSATAWVVDDAPVMMDVFFLGNADCARGESGNQMFGRLAKNETIAGARGPVIVLFYVPWKNDFVKHFSVTDAMVRPWFDAFRPNIEARVAERLRECGIVA
jgi:hypothetical protein